MGLDFTQPAPKLNSLDECNALIEVLWGLCAQIEDLKKEVLALRKENAELKEKLNLNSNNSSKPPSSDLYKNSALLNKSLRYHHVKA